MRPFPVQIDDSKLDEFLGKVVRDVGAAMSAALVVIGDDLGLWRALASASTPLTPKELARRTDTSERYIREWLDAMAAGGYVTYCTNTLTYRLDPEQAMALADESAFVAGLYQVTAAMWAGRAKIGANFRSGAGLDRGQQHPALFEGTERFSRAGYQAHLVQSWLPALHGVVGKLERGAKVADIGCGTGASTIIMAQAFPGSTFFGFDAHPRSVEVARQKAKDASVADRVTFEVATALDFPGHDYDLIASFDSFHDVADPVAAARHARFAVAPAGTWLIVEPFAGDRPEDNHTPVGRMYYSTSTMLSVPHALAQPGGSALGAQAGEARLREHVVSGGWVQLQRATETPLHLVLEARP